MFGFYSKRVQIETNKFRILIKEGYGNSQVTKIVHTFPLKTVD